MDEAEYKGKYINLRILKSIQEYLKKDGAASPTAVYPIRVPDELLFQVLQLEGAENADSLIHDIFELGLTFWSEQLYDDVFGSEQNLEEFIEMVKKRNRERQ
ncbi:MAG: hypothetical protein KAV87_55060 [Desulfobacteraceae bacterium]|nr:hypothetical protein [Desulfobacteraceae bacterium]